MAKLIDPVLNSLSNDDLLLLSRAFNDEKFKLCFQEFASQFCNPEKRSHYRSEVKKYEKQRGVDVTFLQPSLGVTLKATNSANNGAVFINIASCHNIRKPDFIKSGDNIKWSVPLAILKPRLETHLGDAFSGWLNSSSAGQAYKAKEKQILLDFETKGISVYDVIVHPVCIDVCQTNSFLTQYLIDTAIESIYSHLKVKLIDSEVISFNSYIGQPETSMVKTVVNSELYKKEEESLTVLDNTSKGELDILSNKDYDQFGFESKRDTKKNICDIVIPKYEIKHITHVNLQNYASDECSKPLSLRPQGILLRVFLPAVKAASQIDVETCEKNCTLEAKGDVTYQLKVLLPYLVEEEPKKAKFDLSSNVLEIEYIVIKDDPVKGIPILHSSSPEYDSGYTTHSDVDKSSLSSIDEEIGLHHINDSDHFEEFTSKLLHFQQSEKYLWIIVLLNEIDKDSLKILVQGTDTFEVNFSLLEHKMIVRSIEFFTEPYKFDLKSFFYKTIRDRMIIKIEKIDGGYWSKVKVNAKDVEMPEVSEPDCCGLYDDCGIEEISPCFSSTVRDKVKSDEALEKKDECHFYKLPLLPHYEVSQSEDTLFIKFLSNQGIVEDFHTEVIDSKTFKFYYKNIGNGFTALCYGGFLSTAPYPFRNKSIVYHVDKESVFIEVKKKKNGLWRKVKIGQEQKNMKLVMLQSSDQQNDEDGNEDAVHIDKEAISLDDGNSDEEIESGDVSESRHSSLTEHLTNAQESSLRCSGGINIPMCSKENSYSFLTGSWPRGILKYRSSESLNESYIHNGKSSSKNTSESIPDISSISREVDGDPETSLKLNDDELNPENIESLVKGGSLPAKKTVRFNEFVCKQVFRRNASILGQRAKNQKKARQKKRSLERKLSEGSQSSGTETETEVSDRESLSKNVVPHQIIIVGGKDKNVKKKKSKTKSKKPSLNISNDMVFQLDVD